ncbi:flavin-containing monooxygenase FMO GS-OX-like 3 isoform X2 [Phalaenopsis equestris]|uniref:flavin-containing monooxygenase FMO GS-OX-like 3 isoform X2 n=1 Tax=Phalaenopsis equestris TaxID=78828 RepID=UPI0009E1D6C8|nr:flavin-containing monooxygenase FMO GS-OX-like 3 isoform X2 [Phalaenopsis equestris]
MPKSCSVAVIGGGVSVSGLCAARELLREGHRVVVFEKTNRIGGTWVYNPYTDSDPSGLDPARRVAQGNLYRSLRTNIPRPLMGFSDYPFPDPEASFGDPRAFPGHGEVLAFVETFAREEGLLDVVRLGVEVVRVEQVGERKDEWEVEWRQTTEATEARETELFEAVVVCNGHNSELRFADIPGIQKWPGKQIHSHNYRIPEPFLDQVVVIIGKGASAFDISKEISKLAKEVHVASRTTEVKLGKLDNFDNIWQHLMIKCVHEDGNVVFEDGFEVIADVILHCTGYIFSFPFLKENKVVCVDDSRVGPLFKHVFPPHLAPWISFIGISKHNFYDDRISKQMGG